MTHAELQELKTLSRALDTIHPSTKEWDEAYDRYCELCAKEQAEYRAENIDKLKAYYDKYIAGKTWDEIDAEDWGFYSDYHKDVFGYRPRSLNFGEYVPVNYN